MEREAGLEVRTDAAGNLIGRRKGKVERPSMFLLLKDVEELGYWGTGKKYGVSDNAIRKWLK